MHRVARVTAAVLATLLCTGAALQPQTEKTIRLTDLVIVEKTETYDLPGRTADELAAALRRHGIRFETGDDYRGVYVSRLDWQYRFAPEGRASCRVTKADVQLSSITVLPRWTAPRDAAPGLAADWSRFLERLRAHEQKHRDLTVTRARQLMPKLRRLRAKDCAALERAVKYFGDLTVQDIDALNGDYDARTRHGLLEGVRWPPGPEAKR